MANPFTLTPDEMLAGIERQGRKGVYCIDSGVYLGENRAVVDQLRSEGKVALIDVRHPDSIDKKVYLAQYVHEFKNLGLIEPVAPDDENAPFCDYYWRAEPGAPFTAIL